MNRNSLLTLLKRLALPLSLTVGLVFVFVPQGCGGVQPVGKVPEHLAQPIKTCTVEHTGHLKDADHIVAFDVMLDSDGYVDAITLVKSTVDDEELQTCMVRAIRSLTEDDLLRLRPENGDREATMPESRKLLGHPAAAAACLLSPPCVLILAFAMGATMVTVQLMVHAATAKPVATTTAPPIAVPRRWPGQTCTNEELDRLQDEKDKICNGGYAANCNPKNKGLGDIPCSTVKLSLQQRYACLAARWDVQNKCFDGKPDDRHKKPIDETQLGIDNCELLKSIVCAPGHPMANL